MTEPARIRVIRLPARWRDRAILYRVIIDDEVIGALSSGSYGEFDVEPGDHRVRIMADRRFGSEEWGVQLKEGEVGYFECRSNAGALTIIDLIRHRPWIDLHPIGEP